MSQMDEDMLIVIQSNIDNEQRDALRRLYEAAKIGCAKVAELENYLSEKLGEIDKLQKRADELEKALMRIRSASGAVPKDFRATELLELNGRILDHAHKALGTEL
jgi:hypothetical protein